MKAFVLGAVFARGGSKGVPGKNLRLIGGRSLVAHAVTAAISARGISRVIVSTDDEAIKQAAVAAGAEAPFTRPADLSTDNASEWLAWRHALLECERLGFGDGRIDTLVSVPATAPLRRTGDVTAAIEKLEGGGFDLVLSMTPSRRSPYFNMVVEEHGEVRVVIPQPGGGPMRRQDAPPTFDIATVVYAARRDYVVEAPGLFGGRVGAIVVPEESAVDIDTEFDLEMATWLWTRGERQS